MKKNLVIAKWYNSDIKKEMLSMYELNEFMFNLRKPLVITTLVKKLGTEIAANNHKATLYLGANNKTYQVFSDWSALEKN